MLWNQPLSLNLIGMKTKVQELIDKFFMRGSEHRLCTITGLAGMGKSALAYHVIQLVQERVILDGGVVNVRCRSLKDMD